MLKDLHRDTKAKKTSEQRNPRILAEVEVIERGAGIHKKMHMLIKMPKLRTNIDGGQKYQQ